MDPLFASLDFGEFENLTTFIQLEIRSIFLFFHIHGIGHCILEYLCYSDMSQTIALRMIFFVAKMIETKPKYIN